MMILTQVMEGENSGSVTIQQPETVNPTEGMSKSQLREYWAKHQRNKNRERLGLTPEATDAEVKEAEHRRRLDLGLPIEATERDIQDKVEQNTRLLEEAPQQLFAEMRKEWYRLDLGLPPEATNEQINQAFSARFKQAEDILKTEGLGRSRIKIHRPDAPDDQVQADQIRKFQAIMRQLTEDDNYWIKRAFGHPKPYMPHRYPPERETICDDYRLLEAKDLGLRDRPSTKELEDAEDSDFRMKTAQIWRALPEELGLPGRATPEQLKQARTDRFEQEVQRQIQERIKKALAELPAIKQEQDQYIREEFGLAEISSPEELLRAKVIDAKAHVEHVEWADYDGRDRSVALSELEKRHQNERAQLNNKWYQSYATVRNEEDYRSWDQQYGAERMALSQQHEQEKLGFHQETRRISDELYQTRTPSIKVPVKRSSEEESTPILEPKRRSSIRNRIQGYVERVVRK